MSFPIRLQTGRRSTAILILFLCGTFASIAPAQTRGTVLTNAGWTITVDEHRRSLTVAHDSLDTVLENVRLGPGRWARTQASDRVLTIQTTDPAGSWSFETGPNWLKISTTDPQAVLQADAPTPPQRIVARLLDDGGIPVDWSGTREVADGYDGEQTRHPSFLPDENPDVMYFALGEVAGDNMHSLFDRLSDTGIDFTRLTKFTRSGAKHGELAVTIPVPGEAVLRLRPDYYTKTLGVPYYIPFDDHLFPTAPMVWSSWTSYYSQVAEKDVVENADWLAAHLKAYGFQYVQLDDGYDRGDKGQHFWINHWDRTKFPHGPQWLTAHIRSDGFQPGIWLVPNAYAGAVDEHPDWYVRNRRGETILDYKTPTLDSSNPAVIAFLRHLFTTLTDWGFSYFKFDGENAFPRYIPAVDRSALHDPSADLLQQYRTRLKVIRDVVGPNVFIEGCPAGTPLNGIGFFNSYFNGDDVYNSWPGMYAFFSSINANAFLNHILVYVMPGEGIEVGPLLNTEDARTKRVPEFVHVAETREKTVGPFGTTLPEARTLTTYSSLTGVVYSLSSILPELPEERTELVEKTLPTLPILPMDLFSRGTDMRWDKFKTVDPDSYIHHYPEVLDLKVNAAAGTYDVVGVTNWRSQPAHRTINLAEKLGLPAGMTFVAFDFWNQKLLGTVSDHLDLDVEPHDTRVVLLHPLLSHPQLVGNSRHISGSYSVRSVSWDSAGSTLSGVSETIPGKPYTLHFFVPERIKLSRLQVLDAAKKPISNSHKQEGSDLTLTITADGTAARWRLRFAK